MYQFMLGTSRATVGEPVLLSTQTVDVKHAASGMLTAGVNLGIAGTVGLAVASLLLPQAYGAYVPALAAFTVGLMCFDSRRYWYFSRFENRSAFVLDASWLTLQVLLFWAIAAAGIGSAQNYLLAWGVSAFAVVLIDVSIARVLPSWRWFRAWAHNHRQMSGRFFGEYLAISGGQQSIVLFGAWFGTLQALAGLRGVQVVMGPLNTASAGATTFILPTLARVSRTAPEKMILRSLTVSAVLVTLTVAYSLAAWAIPATVGSALLGESWAVARQFIPLYAGILVASNIAYGATAGLRAMGAVRASFRLRLITTPLVVTLIGIMAASFGMTGALFGALCGGIGQAAVWWATYGILWRTRNRS